MAIKRKTTRKQTEAEKQLAKELVPFYEHLNHNNVHTRFSPFLHCTATYGVVNYNGDNWLVLRSYRTIVSAYLIGTSTLIHFGRYSATTYQHQRKFEQYVDDFYNPHGMNIASYWLDYVDNFQ